MDLTQRQKEIQSAVTQAFHKAQEDIDIKKRLAKVPEEVISELTGFKVKKSEILEVANEDFYNKVAFDDLELNEEQLEVIAGGKDKDEHNGFTWDQFRFLMGWY